MNPQSENEYDLLVVGAGIYGAWMAYDASLRGLKVLIVDKGDIANATSSASSKLIHGGLRYLEQFNFSLVKKSVKERQNLFQIAPHRVKHLKFGIPVYKGDRIAPWKYSLGLTIYDWFANIKNKAYKHQSLKAAKFLEEFPFLQEEAFTKGFTYLDANTDDFRYTLEIIDGAIAKGAELRTYCELLKYEDQTAILQNSFSKEESSVKFKYAINASGQWTDRLFDSKMCRLSKGAHIILPNIGLKQALLLLSPIDERVFFTLPWYGKTMIGTTDTDYSGDVDKVEANEEDHYYLLESFNHYLKSRFTEKDIISSFAGLRVLKNDEGHPSSVSRDWEWREMKPNIFVSLGGKLTSSREDSSLLIDHICKKMNIDKSCKTASLLFPWTPIDFDLWKEEIHIRAQKLTLSDEQMELLISRHGRRTEQILNSMEENDSLKEVFIAELPFTLAELQFVLKEEFVYTLEDLIRRRFPIILLKKLSEKEIEHI
ncbi:MAG: glycerol-3-phosphate dehydrogenase/oxidase, partial [Lentisphaeraceae bacterium]|nr:glycerol-3-phosphate dehydrogenase/oxidase [Lentisphaeraceae bacterium]